MQVQTTAEKFVVFAAAVDQALDVESQARESIKAQWRVSAQQAIDLFGHEWIHYAMMSKRDPTIVKEAKRAVDAMKAEDSERAKTYKEYAQGIKSAIVERVKARSESGGNPREQYSRFLAYCVDILGFGRYVPREAAPGTGSGTTSFDKVAEALRVLRNHLPQCEPQAVENLLGMWSDIEEAAIDDGILKEV